CHSTLLSASLFTSPAPPEISTLSLHDALPISSGSSPASGARPLGRLHRQRADDHPHPAVEGPQGPPRDAAGRGPRSVTAMVEVRSEEHTSELQSRSDLVCRLLLEKKKTEV